jgi:hypothetical protein
MPDFQLSEAIHSDFKRIFDVRHAALTSDQVINLVYGAS